MTTALPQLISGDITSQSDQPSDATLYSYQPNTFPYISNRTKFPSLEDWLKIFYDSIRSFQRTAAADTSVPDPATKASAFAENYKAKLDALAADPDIGAINCLNLCRLR